MTNANKYSYSMDYMMNKVYYPLKGTDLVYELAVIADSILCWNKSNAEAYSLLHEFTLKHYKNKHPDVQFAVRLVRHIIDTVEGSRLPVVHIKNNIVNFIHYNK